MAVESALAVVNNGHLVERLNQALRMRMQRTVEQSDEADKVRAGKRQPRPLQLIAVLGGRRHRHRKADERLERSRESE